jgi:hypothetical protein
MILKVINVTLAVASLFTGLFAAWKWYAPSKIHPKPNWTFEPVEPVLKDMGWDSATKAGQLNSSAAFWTAISVALASASSIVGSLAN